MPTAIVAFSKWIIKDIGTWGVFIADDFIKPKGQESFVWTTAKGTFFLSAFTVGLQLTAFRTCQLKINLLLKEDLINQLLNISVFIHKSIFSILYSNPCHLKSPCIFKQFSLLFLCIFGSIQDGITNSYGLFVR